MEEHVPYEGEGALADGAGSRAGLEDIGLFLLAKTLSYLTGREVGQMSGICRAFREASQDPALWTHLLLRDFEGALRDEWEGFPHTLDHGLYWFGEGNRFHKHGHAGEGGLSFFDPARTKTVVYTHGWELDRVRQRYRETFDYSLNDPVNGSPNITVDAWRAAGWNVGIFYWDQFSDELSVFAAEAKIWSSARDGMLYRAGDGIRFNRSNFRGSIVELFAETLVDALGQDHQGQLRLVGHSLGSQVALGTARALAAGAEAGGFPASLVPTRVALIDPYFSLKLPLINPQPYLPSSTSTAQQAVKFARFLVARGVVLEHLLTSPLAELYGVCNPNVELRRLCACVEWDPAWISPADWQGRHIAAANYYFHSFAFPPPRTCSSAASGAPALQRAPSASSSDEEIRATMSHARDWKFVQTRGSRSLDDLGYDEFELVSQR